MTSKCLSVVSSLVLWVLSTIIMKTKCGFKRHYGIGFGFKAIVGYCKLSYKNVLA